jgi:hypothetical protein
MQETAHPTILDRSEAIDTYESHLSVQGEMLRDLANYGSNLCVRAFFSSQKKLDDIVICGVFLKQVVAMLDATEVLLANGCGLAAFLPARSAFEASVYMDWVMRSDSPKKAALYIVGDYREQKKWALRSSKGTAEEESFSKTTARFGLDIHKKRPELDEEAKKLIGSIDHILGDPELNEANELFNKASSKKRFDPEWYTLTGATSLRNICEKIDRLTEYEFFYSKGSQVTHTGTYRDHVRFQRGTVQLLPVRHLDSSRFLINFSVSIALNAYRKIIERYRHGELPAFQEKYLLDWREPFQKTPDISYKF